MDKQTNSEAKDSGAIRTAVSVEQRSAEVASHTALPWRAEWDGDQWVIRNAHRCVAVIDPHDKERDRIDAETIVRAVNAHAELVELAAAFVSYLKDDSRSERRRLECLEQAIAKLEEQSLT